MEIKRSDKQYTDIEEFEEYEFTSCISYEMMIRNPDLVKILKRQLCDTNIFNDPKDSEDAFLMYGMPDRLHFDYHFFKVELDTFEKQKGYSLISSYEKFNTQEENEYEINTFIEYDGFIRRTRLSKDGGVPYYEDNTIRTYFKRPEVEIYEFDNVADVRLDLSKPIDELVAYIKHLKKAYEDNIINTPFDDFVQNIPLHTNKKGLPKGAVMGDVFYIYDALLLDYSRKKIQLEIYNFYADQGIETRTMDYKTLKKYHEFSIEYIENKRYLELATGKKLEEIKLGTLLQ